jgi:hypothetical protein
VVRAVGDAGFDITGIAVDELTFQLNNAVGSLGRLLTQLGGASGSPLAQGVVAAVRGLAFAPALAVFNFGSPVAKAVIATAKEGFDAVVDIGSTIAGSPHTTTASAQAADDGVASTAIPRQPENTDAGELVTVGVVTEKATARGEAGTKKTAPGKASANKATTRAPAVGHSRRSAGGTGEGDNHA